MLMWSFVVSSIIGVLTVLSIRTGISQDTITIYRDEFALAFAFVFGFSCSTSATAIASSYAYQSRSFGFLFHRMGIKKLNLMGSLIFGVIVTFIMNGTFLFLILLLLLRLRLGLWILPVNIAFNLPMIIFMSILDGFIFTSIALLIVSIVLITSRTKILVYARYIPFFLYIVTFILMTNGLHGFVEYIFPYSSVFYILNYLFSGSDVYYSYVISPIHPNLFLCFSGIFLFLIFVMIIIYLLIDHIYAGGDRNDRQF
ncbi:hypothetical protein ACNF40_06425 [Cuniculiplasma sp. SKW4]|uniref:hypothetical protein n=1 Tax=Cuniculiplasma sp. SKW4 TaxID=3400171 RepID=UPI003FD5D09F